VAGLGFAAIGNFALDADVGEVFGKEVADLSGQLADGEGLAVGHEVEAELLGHFSQSVFRDPWPVATMGTARILTGHGCA